MDTLQFLLGWLGIVGGIGALFAGVVQILVGVFKTTFPKVPATYYPATSLILGILFGLLMFFATPPSTMTIWQALIGGGLAGLGGTIQWRGAKLAAIESAQDKASGIII